MYIKALLKLTGAILVIMTACLFAKEANGMMKLRIVQITKLYSILSQLQSKLKYMNNTLPECFSDFYHNTEFPFDSWFNNMAERMNEERTDDFSSIWSGGLNYLYDNSALHKSDIEILSGLKDKLNSYDVDEGIKAIDFVLLQLEERRKELITKSGEKQKVVVSLCLFVGLMTVLLLI